MRISLILSLVILALTASGQACQYEGPAPMAQPSWELDLFPEDEPLAQTYYGRGEEITRFDRENQEPGRIYFLALRDTGEHYMTLDKISVIEGYAPDYRNGGSWYFQLIDADQRVLEEGHFDHTGMVCGDQIDRNGQWTGGCYESNTPLVLEIPYHYDGADITVYDGNGIVRFGPYDVRARIILSVGNNWGGFDE